MNRLAITLLYVFLSACATQQQMPLQDAHSPAIPFLETDCQDTIGVGVTDKWNGKKIVGKTICVKNPLPYVVIEQHKLYPEKPQAGLKFTQCFIYTVCDSDSTSSKPIKATLSRKVFKNGKEEPKLQDNSKVNLKSGTWLDVAKIKPSRETNPDTYIFQLSFSIDLPFEITK